jgi:transcriptional regulator with PAS, ATPase and Fis domain
MAHDRQGQTAVALVPPDDSARPPDDADRSTPLPCTAPGDRTSVILGRSAAIERIRAEVARLARASLPVLIVGESGTGKELIARALHEAGPRAPEPFVSENCAALPEALFESLLFGHSRGSFTGAERDHAGLFLQAAGGTIFLDEVAELPLSLQSKLLRVLQERQARPVGSTQLQPVRCRIVAATNRDPAALIAGGRFRPDLFYRLSGANIEVPPLRERLSDLPILAGHFLDKIARESGIRFLLGEAALRFLLGHHWPGNVRELSHEIERATVFSRSHTLEPADFSARLRARAGMAVAVSDGADPDSGDPRGATFVTACDESAGDSQERLMIERTLLACRGNLSRAALEIGWNRPKLRRRMRLFGIDRGFGR